MVADNVHQSSLHNLLPGLESHGARNPPAISDADVESLLLAKHDGRGEESFGCESESEFIPTHRTGPGMLYTSGSFPWSPLPLVLAWLWAPSHRLMTSHAAITQPSNTHNSDPWPPSRVVFIVGSTGSGKRELLQESYRVLRAGLEDGPLEGWMPPVDIIILPDIDSMCLRLVWTPGAFGSIFDASIHCTNRLLTGRIDLSQNIPASLFQDCIARWKAKHEKNTYPPQILFQGLHLLSPEHQGMLLDVISRDAASLTQQGGC